MKLSNIKSLGKKTEEVLNNIGIKSAVDLLTYYPYKYNFIKLQKLNEFSASTNGYVEAEIISSPTVMYVKKNFNRLSFKVMIDSEILNVTIFNRAFLKQNLIVGRTIVLIGKYNSLKNNFLASDIKFNFINNSIEPIYHLSSGIKQAQLKKYINNAMELTINDKIPNYINEKYNFIEKNKAIKLIHNPTSLEDIKKSRLKLIYEELFEFMFKINYLKFKNQNECGIERKVNILCEQNFIKNLPFEPTKDQLKAFEEIKIDLTGKRKMNRLILGDVGSGKTLVATYSIYLNFLSGYQTAFMAPTEILAVQHYHSIKKMLQKYNICTEIITGKMSKKEKESIRKRLMSNEINLLIGTHAIINEDIIFNNLGLVITDEQHRFGVMQRKNLENKAINPDVLFLSATPIPRTYALVLYGDSDVSIIKTKPSGRKEILTKIYKEKEIKEVLRKCYEELNNKHQIFVVSPLIDNNDSELNSVFDLKEKLSKAFKDNFNIEIIHGGMKQSEKDAIMHEYISNNINILISTTVIEVGVDVPNASVMVIFNAERFGLATLHQLRGRVGRSELQSYCYLISEHNSDRLKVMEESNDGFYITEKDFENRKEGDLFGTKQSGDMVFKIANLKKDYQIVMQTQKDAEEFVKQKKYTEYKYYTDLIENIKFLN